MSAPSRAVPVAVASPPALPLRRLGRSGLKVTAFGLGGNTFGQTMDGDEAVRVIHHALDRGVNFVDTADLYSNGRSEELVGQALRGRRQRVIVGTKVRHPVSGAPHEGGLSRRWIMQAAENSLRRLKTDYIDLYQLHAPDPETPIEETLRALDDLVRQGKVRYVGCSNFKAWEMAEGLGVAERFGLPRFVSAQNRWNLAEGVDDPTLPDACQALEVGIIAYAVLAGGILTGKYERGVAPPPGTRAGDMPHIRARITEDKLSAVDHLRPWVEERGHTLADLCVAYVASQPATGMVIVGARNTEQVDANLRALGWTLTPDEQTEVARLARGG